VRRRRVIHGSWKHGQDEEFRDGNLLAPCHRQWFTALMSDHIYKKIELVGSSPNGIEDAINNAITRAGKTIRNMKWFEVAEVRGHLENNKVADWQVTVKVGFTLDS
jgi:flavin-binding protein dodecin